MYNVEYGSVREIRTKAEIVIAGKSPCTVMEGDIVDVDFKSPIDGHSGCTGKIILIDAKQFVIDCSVLFSNRVVFVERSNIASMGFAEKPHIRDMYDCGGGYL